MPRKRIKWVRERSGDIDHGLAGGPAALRECAQLFGTSLKLEVPQNPPQESKRSHGDSVRARFDVFQTRIRLLKQPKRGEEAWKRWEAGKP